MTVAAGALEEAERADAAAREARAAAAPEAPLAQAHSRPRRPAGRSWPTWPSAERAAQRAAAAREAAEAALAAAEQARRQRQAELEEARRAHVVAGLRPHLVAGEPCPVCEQTVATLPAPLPAHEVDAAQARLAEADRAVTAAQSAARKADSSGRPRPTRTWRPAPSADSSRQPTWLSVLSGPLAVPVAAARAAPPRSGRDGRRRQAPGHR